MRGGEAVRRALEAKEAWPYTWDQAPPGSEHVFAFGAVEVPDAGAGNAVVVCQYNVTNNYRGVLQAHLFEYAGGNYNPGDFNWSITVNVPLLSTLAQGVTWKGYNQVPFNIGSRAGGPWPIGNAQLNILESRDQVRVVATNVNLNPGSPNFFVAALVGYEFPDA